MNTTSSARRVFVWYESVNHAQNRKLVTYALIAMSVVIALGGWNILTWLDAQDRQLMVLLNFTGSTTTDHFWYSYSQLTSWIPLIGVVFFFCMAAHPGKRKDKLLFLMVLIILIAFLDQVSSGLIKPLAGRLRPSHDPSICGFLHYVNGYKGGKYGFVSGHATNITGLTTWLCLTFRHRLMRITFILFAVMMCYSRIYLGVHYPGDVLCGALLGFTIAWSARRILAHRLNLYVSDRPLYGVTAVFAATLVFLLITI